jgi:hypothetical protein
MEWMAAKEYDLMARRRRGEEKERGQNGVDREYNGRMQKKPRRPSGVLVVIATFYALMVGPFFIPEAPNLGDDSFFGVGRVFCLALRSFFSLFALLLDFFTPTIRNRNSRADYARACWQFLIGVRPFHVAAWIETFRDWSPQLS